MSLLSVKKGNSSNLDNVSIQDGQLLFTTDTKEIYLDHEDNRLQISYQFATDNEILDMMASIDALPVLADENDTIYTDEADNILLI